VIDAVILIYLMLGVFAGLVAGLLGVGGGLIVVPALAMLFQQQGIATSVVVHLAVGTSLLTMVLTSLSSVYAHHRRAAVLWPVLLRLLPGFVVGAGVGAAAADFMPTSVLRILFGLFELVVALQMGLDIKPAAYRKLPAATGMFAAGGGIGAMSAILGIGGGTMTVPFLVACNIGVRNAIATSAACGLPIALAGGLGFVVIGWNEEILPQFSTGFVYWPAVAGIAVASVLFAPIGAKLAHQLPTKVLRRLFSLLLTLLAIKMLWG